MSRPGGDDARRAPSPRPPGLPAELPEQAFAALTPELVVEEVAVADADLSNATAPGVALRRVRLRSTRLAGGELDGLELSDAELHGCDLANLRTGRHGGLLRVCARVCRMTGFAMADGVVRDVTFDNCRIDLASFGGCRLQRVRFVDCTLAQTDFLEAELDGVAFHGCDLTATDLRGARLRRCELRDNRLEGLRGVEALRGAAMPWVDIVGAAGLWAQALGIELLDEPGGEPSPD